MNLKTVYQGAVKCEYAVRGRVVARAMELERKGMEVVYCNIGNPQSLGQSPLTFVRQVLSMVTYPELIDYAKKGKIPIPLDAVARAERYVKSCPGHSSGAYTHSAGIPEIRDDVAKFLKRRDGCDSDPNDIFLTDGASPAVQMLMRLLIRNPNDGVMLPVPRYPLYSALLDLNNGSRVDYFLDERNGWQLGLCFLFGDDGGGGLTMLLRGRGVGEELEPGEREGDRYEGLGGGECSANHQTVA